MLAFFFFIVTTPTSTCGAFLLDPFVHRARNHRHSFQKLYVATDPTKPITTATEPHNNIIQHLDELISLDEVVTDRHHHHHEDPPLADKKEEEEPKIWLDSDGNIRIHDQIVLEKDDGSDIHNDFTLKHDGSGGVFFQLSSDFNDRPITITKTLGRLQGVSSLLACGRVNRYWMEPTFGQSADDLPLDTQFALAELDNDSSLSSKEDKGKKEYALFLPLVDGGYRANLSTSDKKKGEDIMQLSCHSEGDRPSSSEQQSPHLRVLYMATGSDPYQLIQDSIQQVSNELQTFRTRQEKNYIPPLVKNGFGWCTWDAFYSDVSPEGIMEGIQTLSNQGVPPRTLIIDDGWQQVTPKKQQNEVENKKKKNRLSVVILQPLQYVTAKLLSYWYENYVHNAPHESFWNKVWKKVVPKSALLDYYDDYTDFARQLQSFEPNSKFQNLTSFVEELKNPERVGAIELVYCWHALHGYWRGMDADLGLAHGMTSAEHRTFDKPSQHVLSVDPSTAWDPVSLEGVGLISSPQDAQQFFQSLHTPLSQAGIDGVKVDVQSGVSGLTGGGTGPNLAELYTCAMEESVAQQFGEKHSLNCMCHSTENFYRYKVTNLARASDDFFPTKPLQIQIQHLLNVVYNSVFLSHICWMDYDMFQSNHEQGGFHAAARAISGGPIYISDKPGQHDADLLKQLVLPDGSTLPCVQPAQPTRDCLLRPSSDGTLKLYNVHGDENSSGVVGVFGVDETSTTIDKEIFVKPSMIEPFNKQNKKQSFAIWQYSTKNLIKVNHADESIQISSIQQAGDYDLFTIAPIQRLLGGMSWAPIGLINMMNSGGALVNSLSSSEEEDSSNSVTVSCRGPGTFIAFCHPRPRQVLVGGNIVPFMYQDEGEEKAFLQLELPTEIAKDTPHSIQVTW